MTFKLTPLGTRDPIDNRERAGRQSVTEEAQLAGGAPPAPSADRREQRKIARRTRILQVAQQCFKQGGYAGTTMSHISAQLGGSKGTLWNHFPSKEALFSAVVTATATRVYSALLSPLDPVGEPRQVLEQFAQRFIESIVSDDSVSLQRMVIAESIRFPQIGLILYAQGPAVAAEVLVAYIEQLMAGRTIRADDCSHSRAVDAINGFSGVWNRIVYTQ